MQDATAPKSPAPKIASTKSLDTVAIKGDGDALTAVKAVGRAVNTARRAAEIYGVTIPELFVLFGAFGAPASDVGAEKLDMKIRRSARYIK